MHHGYGHLDYVVLIYRHGLRCTYSLLYTLLVLLRDTLPRCLTYVVVHPVPPRHYPVSSLSFPVLCDYTQGCHRHTHTIMCCPQSTGSSSISFFNRDRPRWCRPRRGGLSHILSKDFLVIGQVGLQATHSLGSELFSRQCNTLLFNTSLLSVFLSCALPQSVRYSLALP